MVDPQPTSHCLALMSPPVSIWSYSALCSHEVTSQMAKVPQGIRVWLQERSRTHSVCGWKVKGSVHSMATHTKRCQDSRRLRFSRAAHHTAYTLDSGPGPFFLNVLQFRRMQSLTPRPPLPLSHSRCVLRLSVWSELLGAGAGQPLLEHVPVCDCQWG